MRKLDRDVKLVATLVNKLHGKIGECPQCVR